MKTNITVVSPFKHGMQMILENAMKKVNTPWSPFTVYCWWSDPMVNAVVNYGVKRGWLWRVSTTQCGYREELFYRAPNGRHYFKPGIFA